MALTAIEISKSKAADKPQKLADGGGLYLLIQPNGAKYWRLDYRFGGKRKTLALGGFILTSACWTRKAAAMTHASCWRTAQTPAW